MEPTNELTKHRQTPRATLDVALPPRSFLAPAYPLAKAPYTQTDVFAPAFSAGVTSGGVGLFISAVKNSLESHNKGALGVFTRTGWIAGYFG